MLLPGCVRRRLMVRSNPPGAMVYVDNQPIGTTPCATDFVYYGTREIRLVKPGFETLTVSQPIPAPWYEIPPLDFVSENLVPRKIQDYRTVSFNMVPQVIVPTEQLLSRAEQLRQSTMQGVVLPASATSLPGITTPVIPANPGPLFVAPENVAPGQVLPRGGQPLELLPTPSQ
ncbi:MAG: PEGA domain-containing protein [Planctomycetes bacterium]|nr:PEGA domain-containing protein [Planctomycetota bacterium]